MSNRQVYVEVLIVLFLGLVLLCYLGEDEARTRLIAHLLTSSTGVRISYGRNFEFAASYTVQVVMLNVVQTFRRGPNSELNLCLLDSRLFPL